LRDARFAIMYYSDEHVALCALNRIFGYHPHIAVSLMEKAGGAVQVFSGDYASLSGPHPELLSQLEPSALDWAKKELERLDSNGWRFLCLADEDYPTPLRECSDPPLGLYLSGSSSATEIFELRPMIGFVGTRDISPYGTLWCQKLVKALAQAPVQPCIVSGMALGADGIAHRTALSCGLPTIGVMATGIDSIYPWQHEKLAADIISRPGCGLISDYPLDTAPLALNFIRRNRIIAGLVSAVVVVESKTKGGSLMTAKYAVNYSREVYAVPGRIDDIRSAGCNSLIGSEMARIIVSPEQLVADLGLSGGKAFRGPGGSWVTSQVGDPPSAVLQAALTRRFGPGAPLIETALAIQANQGVTVDALAGLLHRPFPAVLADIGTLEANGIITTDLLRRCSLTPDWS